MREDHHEIQTPKKEQLQNSSNRKAKSVNAQSKKLHNQQQKSIKKNLCSVFNPITDGDLVINLSEKESIEQISSISGAFDADHSTVDISKTSSNSDLNLVSDNTVAVQLPEDSVRISEAFVFDEDHSSIESYIASLNQYISPSFATTSSVQTTPLSTITTAEMTPSSSSFTRTPESASFSIDSLTHDVTTTEDMNSIKVESLVKHLRVSMLQVLHSADINPLYKKLLNQLVKIMIEEFGYLHDQKNTVVELFSTKVKKIMVLSFVLGILLVSAGFFLFSDAQSSYHSLPPT